jgi:predicted metal-dependent peptidase
MRRLRNFQEYQLLKESFSSYGMTEENYEKSVMKVKRCISKILMKGGFFGNVLSEIPVAVSKECEFFSTDGTVFIFNPENVLEMSDDEVIWAINQGIIHLALQHFDRKQDKDQSLWNRACDVAAEPYLEGIGKSILPSKYRNPKFEGKSAEEIYAELEKEGADTFYKSYCDVLEPGEIDTEKTTETIMGEIDSVRGEEEHKLDKKEFKDKKEETESGKGEEKNPADDPQEEGGEEGGEEEGGEEGGDIGPEGGDIGPEGGEEGGGDIGPEGGDIGPEGGDIGPEGGDGEPGGEWGEGGEGEDKKDWDEKIEKKEPISKKDISKKIQEITERAANKGTGGGGVSPALRKFIEDLVNPQVDWRKILQRYVSESDDDPTMYKIPNRRYASRDIYLPGLKGKEEGFGTVVIAVDTSGSIGQDEYNTFLAESRSVLKTFQPKEIYIIYCSDGMEPPSGGIDRLASAAQPLDKSKQMSTGGNAGGFDPPIKWVEENLIKKGKDLACMIYFTDGGAEDPGKPKWHRKMIWAMTTSHKMPFGKHVNVPVNKLRK